MRTSTEDASYYFINEYQSGNIIIIGESFEHDGVVLWPIMFRHSQHDNQAYYRSEIVDMTFGVWPFADG
jgi:hypothetical protein